MGLIRYKAKRDFSRTREPGGGTRVWAAPHGSALKFVVQKHDATRLHYDFRLEMGGVLKSWAVPKGIPTVKGDRRLAMEVEDHPVEYGEFEGTIPSGNYGAGTVMLWDAGTYESLDQDPEVAWAAGKLSLLLKGRKLRGRWALVQMRRAGDRDERAWLLIKTGQDMRPISARADDRSVKSRRSMKQITTGTSRVSKSKPSESKVAGSKAKSWLKRKVHSRV